MRKPCKMTETQEHGYSSDRTQQELSYEYPHDRVWMYFITFGILVHRTKVTSASEGLTMQLPIRSISAHLSRLSLLHLLLSSRSWLSWWWCVSRARLWWVWGWWSLARATCFYCGCSRNPRTHTRRNTSPHSCTPTRRKIISIDIRWMKNGDI